MTLRSPKAWEKIPQIGRVNIHGKVNYRALVPAVGEFYLNPQYDTTGKPRGYSPICLNLFYRLPGWQSIWHIVDVDGRHSFTTMATLSLDDARKACENFVKKMLLPVTVPFETPSADFLPVAA